MQLSAHKHVHKSVHTYVAHVQMQMQTYAIHSCRGKLGRWVGCYSMYLRYADHALCSHALLCSTMPRAKMERSAVDAECMREGSSDRVSARLQYTRQWLFKVASYDASGSMRWQVGHWSLGVHGSTRGLLVHAVASRRPPLFVPKATGSYIISQLSKESGLSQCHCWFECCSHDPRLLN